MNLALNPGNSGGPLFDSKGRVVGVVVAKAVKQEAIALAVPSHELAAALAKVKDQSDAESRRVSTQHDLEVVFCRVALASKIYSHVMQLYSDALTDPAGKFLSPDERWRKARAQEEARLRKEGLSSIDATNRFVVDEIKSVLTQLGKDPNVSAKVHESLLELWSVYIDMKSYVDAPRGSVEEYLKKSLEWRDKRHKVVELLKIRLGVQDVD